MQNVKDYYRATGSILKEPVLKEDGPSCRKKLVYKAFFKENPGEDRYLVVVIECPQHHFVRSNEHLVEDGKLKE